VEGETLGIAILDHPGNRGYPTRWHARNYGLITTNPIANGAFTGEELTPFTLTMGGRLGGRLDYRYRVLIHRGDAQQSQVAVAYQAYTNPPTGRITE
jgi:hypothetical protein